MDIIYRSAAPRDRGRQPPSTQNGTGGLTRLWSGVFGSGSRPAYKQASRTADPAEQLRCWWRPFAITPQYKTVPADDQDGCVLETPLESPDDEVVVDIGDCESFVW